MNTEDKYEVRQAVYDDLIAEKGTMKEIAERHGVSPNTVYVWRNRLVARNLMQGKKREGKE
jgi:transposase-like protein